MAVTMPRALTLITLAASVGPLAAAGQQPSVPDTRPWYASVSHWAKWPALAGAIGLTAAAILKKDDADQVYDGLLSLCRADSATCIQDPTGVYLDPGAEALYRETLRLDAQARRWMVGGQAVLALTGGMFLIDLVTGRQKPKNIPYTPLEFFGGGERVGLRWRF
ncbi:MAG: hypothetical protein OER21_12530 [Gemmatimonadota bacterium]|nr:hypothetical protein [Gemmatimonadota bacterium]